MILVTPERLRRLRGIGLRAGFGLVVFVIAFYASFPYERVREQVIALAAQRNLDVEIDSAGPTLGVGLAFQGILVKTHPAAGKAATKLTIEQARVSLSPLARLFGENAISLSAEAFGGEIDVDWRSSKTAGRLRIEGQEVAMAELPGVKEAINLPLAGTLELSMDLALPNNKNAEGNGSLSWKCSACAIGDGRAKLIVAGNPLLAEGLGLPRVRLGDLAGRVVFEKGLGKLQAVQAKSPDGELSVEGEIRLADPLPYSQVDLYLRFKLSEALLKSAEKLRVILQLVEANGKRPDGSYGMRLTGTFNRLGAPMWSKTSPFGSAGAPAPRPASSGRPGAAARPSSTATPPSAGMPSRYAQPVDPLKDPNANLPTYATTPPATPPPAPAPTPETPPAPAPTEAAPTGAAGAAVPAPANPE